MSRAKSEEPGVRLLDRRVTPASSGFQAAPVEDLEPAAAVADQPALAQRTGGSSNACATYAQHVGHEFMRDMELVGVRPIASHQQPTGKPRLHDMEAGASGGLCQLAQRYVEVTVQTSLQRRVVSEFTAKCRRFHSPSRARSLHQGVQRCSAYAEHQRDP